ncbi:MAG: hypothetical protein ABIP17_03825 [Ilumatobacteraceae bacterium]
MSADHRDHYLTELLGSDETIALLATPLSTGGQRGALVLVRTGPARMVGSRFRAHP